jgi:hypothetical protein
LCFGRKFGALLELEITNSSREGKVAVHSSEVDEASSGCNPILLGCYAKNSQLATSIHELQIRARQVAYHTFKLRLVIL